MATKLVECSKCDGNGKIAAFGHYAAGVCFVCAGTGTVSVPKRGVAEMACRNASASLSCFQDEMCQPVRVEDTEYYRAYAKRTARALRIYAMYDRPAAVAMLRSLHSTAQHLICEEGE